MIEKNCGECIECCTFLTFGYKEKVRKSAVEFYKAYGCKIYYNDKTGIMYIKVPIKCQHVTQDGCSIYEDRPTECKMLDCDKHPLLKHESRPKR